MSTRNKKHDYKNKYHLSQEEVEREHSESMTALTDSKGRPATAPVQVPTTPVNNYSTNYPDHEILELESEMGFGKHRDRDLRWVIEHDMGYISWLLAKTERTISEEAHQLIEDIENHPYG